MKDWFTRIQEARARGRFTADDKIDAACWATCAVGEHHVAAPDIILYTNGSAFNWAVLNDDLDKAERLYHQIADRAMQLKREHRP